MDQPHSSEYVRLLRRVAANRWVTGSTSMELRDAVAEEPKELFPERRCRSLSLRFVACAVFSRD
jgi:hypothetical protein